MLFATVILKYKNNNNTAFQLQARQLTFIKNYF